MGGIKAIVCAAYLVLVTSSCTSDGQCRADELIDDLQRLAGRLSIQSKRIKTWKGTYFIQQTQLTTDPVLVTRVADDAEPFDDNRSEDPLYPLPQLHGPHYRHDHIIAEYAADLESRNLWVRYRAIAPPDYEDVKSGNLHRASGTPLEFISILAGPSYFSLDCNSRVTALEDPNDTKRHLPLRARTTRRFAVRKARSDAETLYEFGQVFDPYRLFEASGARPEDRLRLYAAKLAEAPSTPISVRADPADPRQTIVKTEYVGSRSDQPQLTVIDHYRDIDEEVTVIVSSEIYQAPRSDRPVYSKAWEWTQVDGIYIPSQYRNSHMNQDSGRPVRERVVTLQDCELNTIIDQAAFSEGGLALAIGDLLQQQPSGRLLLQSDDGLIDATNELPPDQRLVPRGTTLNRLLVVLSLTIIVVLPWAIYAHRTRDS
jgi:hypothetical protein